MIKTTVFYIVIALTIGSCKKETSKKEDTTTDATKWEDTLIYPGEKHFKHIRQITFGGDNAEAYWSFDDKERVFQSSDKDWSDS